MRTDASSFQLPLSGSLEFAGKLVLMLTSFNSLFRDHLSAFSLKAVGFSTVSTPSFGITSILRFEKCPWCKSFNSLFRDHGNEESGVLP